MSWKVRVWTDTWVTIFCVVFLLIFFHDGLKWCWHNAIPCTALNVKVVRMSKQARTNDRRNHDSPRLL